MDTDSHNETCESVNVMFETLEDDDFVWQKVAAEIMMAHRKDEVFDQFLQAKTNYDRLRLLLRPSIIKAIDTRVWKRFQRFSTAKDDNKAADQRKAGNEHFKRRRLDAASAAYTMALFAAKSKESYALAAANRSACLFETEEYVECLEDIETALKNEYPDRLKAKILTRQLECFKRLNDIKSAKKTLTELWPILEGTEDGKKKLKNLVLTVETAEERKTKIPNKPNHVVVNPVAQFSKDVKLKWNNEKGRHLLSENEIKAGSTILEETAFAHILIPDFQFLNCHHCLKLKVNLIPCPGCCDVGYCSLDCLSNDEATHLLECSFMHLLHSVGIAHLSYKIVAIVGVDRAISVAKTQDFKPCSQDRIVNTDDYLNVSKLMTHEDSTAPEDLFQYTLTAILLLRMICSSNNSVPVHFIDNNAVKTTDLLDHYCKLQNTIDAGQSNSLTATTIHKTLCYLGAILLHHVEQLICNASAITDIQVEEAGDRTTTEQQVRIATAIFPRLSMMNHSCDPNIIVSYVGTTVTAKATRPILPGEEIFNCYGPHHLRMSRKERRDALKQQYHFICRCSKCGDGEEETWQKYLDGESIPSALKCQKCSGPVVTHVKGKTPMRQQQCLSCHWILSDTDSHEIKDRVKTFNIHFKNQRQKFRDANASPSSILSLASSVVSKAESVFFSRNLDLAKVYDAVAFHCVQKNLFTEALSYAMKGCSIIESVYGSDSVEAAYELRKLGELEFRLEEFEKALDFTIRSRKILEQCYSKEHKDAKDLAETETQLKTLLQMTRM